MKCPRCGAYSNVLETRAHEYNTLRRRRECGNGHRFTTMEISGAAYGSVKRRLVELAATHRSRWARWIRDKKIAAASKAGATQQMLAKQYALTKSGVQHALERMKGLK